MSLMIQGGDCIWVHRENVTSFSKIRIEELLQFRVRLDVKALLLH